MGTKAVIGIGVAALGVAALAFGGAAGAEQEAIVEAGTFETRVSPGVHVTVTELLAMAAIAGGLALTLVDWIRR